MQLDLTAREYATWPGIVGAPAGVELEVYLDGQWRPLQRVNDTTARILVAGPLATGNPAGTVELPPGVHRPKIRVKDADEVPVRSSGVIEVRA